MAVSDEVGQGRRERRRGWREAKEEMARGSRRRWTRRRNRELRLEGEKRQRIWERFEEFWME